MRSTSLLVWDGEAGDGMGGSASFAGHAVACGRTTIAIHPTNGRVWTPGPEAIAAAQKHVWKTIRISQGNVLEHRLAEVTAG